MTRLHGAEFVTWLLLRRVHRGGLATLGDRYLHHGRPLPSYLPPDLLAELTAAGLLTEADPDESGMRRISLTAAGQARYAELCQRQHGPDLPVPPPQFATTSKTPAGRRSGAPAPGGQPDPAPPAVPPMRWARHEPEVRMHALEPVNVERAPARGYAETLCGDTLPPDVPTANRPSGELCIPCVIRFASALPDPGRRGTAR